MTGTTKTGATQQYSFLVNHGFVSGAVTGLTAPPQSQTAAMLLRAKGGIFFECDITLVSDGTLIVGNPGREVLEALEAGGYDPQLKQLQTNPGQTIKDAQMAFMERTLTESLAILLGIPTYKEILWAALRSGRRLVVEVKGSSPEMAAKAAVAARQTELAFYRKMLDHPQYDQYDLLWSSFGLVWAYTSFSISAMERLMDHLDDHLDDYDSPMTSPRVSLLVPSSGERAKDMAISAEMVDFLDRGWETVVNLCRFAGMDCFLHWSVIDQKIVAYASRHGVKVGAWVTPADQIDRMKSLGVYIIITEQAAIWQRQQLLSRYRKS